MTVRGQAGQRRIAYETALAYMAFGAIYVGLIIPYLIGSAWFSDLNPVVAYMIWNLGWVFVFAGIFGIVVGFIGGDADIMGLITSGVSGFLLFSWVFDMWQGPYYIAPSGQVLLPLATTPLENTAVDGVFGWLFEQVGIHGPLEYYAVYGLIPVVGIVIALLLLTPKQFLHATGIRN